MERIEVKLSDGRVVSCPDVGLKRDDIRPTDTFFSSHGFEHSWTVLDAEGNAKGWILKDECQPIINERKKPKDWRDHVLVVAPPGGGVMLWARLQARNVPLRDWDGRHSDSEQLWRLARMEERWKFGFREVTAGNGGVPVPLRAPHHSVSERGMTGAIAKGWQIRPGELSLAHGGVLLLDQANEFRLSVLTAVFEAMRRGSVVLPIGNGATLNLPAEFRLIAVVQPCPCGFHGAERSTCRCSDEAIKRWKAGLGRLELEKRCRLVPESEWRAELEERKGELA